MGYCRASEVCAASAHQSPAGLASYTAFCWCWSIRPWPRARVAVRSWKAVASTRQGAAATYVLLLRVHLDCVRSAVTLRRGRAPHRVLRAHEFVGTCEQAAAPADRNRLGARRRAQLRENLTNVKLRCVR